MKRLELFYPLRPYILSQGWGIFNPAYSQFGFTLHNGQDCLAKNGQTISAPFDCRVIRVGNQPKGGGIFVGVLSKNKYSFDDGKESFVLADFLHCESITVREGQEVGVGEELAKADNTGFSTGPHTHIQFRRVTELLLPIDINDANNSFDPAPYWNKVYADTWVIWRNILKLWNGLRR